MSLQLFDEPPIVGLVEGVGLLPLPPLLPPLLPLPLPLPPPERLVNLADAILLSRQFSFIAIAFYGRVFRNCKGSRVLIAVRRRIGTVRGVEDRRALLCRNAYLAGLAERAAVGIDNRSVKRRNIFDSCRKCIRELCAALVRRS